MVCHIRGGDLIAAAGLYRRAVELYRRCEETVSVIQGLRLLAECHTKLRLPGAMALLREALALAQDGFEGERVLVLRDMALSGDSVEERLSYAKQARLSAIEAGRYETLPSILSHEAVCRKDRGELDEALALLAEALPVARELGDDWGTSHLLGNRIEWTLVMDPPCDRAKLDALSTDCDEVESLAGRLRYPKLEAELHQWREKIALGAR
jgi:tetratricopeptide (TPR) repeat protein